MVENSHFLGMKPAVRGIVSDQALPFLRLFKPLSWIWRTEESPQKHACTGGPTLLTKGFANWLIPDSNNNNFLSIPVCIHGRVWQCTTLLCFLPERTKKDFQNINLGISLIAELVFSLAVSTTLIVAPSLNRWMDGLTLTASFALPNAPSPTSFSSPRGRFLKQSNIQFSLSQIRVHEFCVISVVLMKMRESTCLKALRAWKKTEISKLIRHSILEYRICHFQGTSFFHQGHLTNEKFDYFRRSKTWLSWL